MIKVKHSRIIFTKVNGYIMVWNCTLGTKKLISKSIYRYSFSVTDLVATLTKIEKINVTHPKGIKLGIWDEVEGENSSNWRPCVAIVRKQLEKVLWWQACLSL